MLIIKDILSRMWPYIVIFLLGLVIWYGINKINELKQENFSKSNAIILMNQEVEKVQTKNGQLLYQNRTMSATEETFRLVLNNELSKLKEEYGSIKDIKGYIKSNINTTNSFQTFMRDSILFDTIPVKTFNYSDKWIKQDCIIRNDSVVCTYTYQDSVEVVIFKTKNWSWYQFSKAREMKKQGFSKYSYKTSIKFSNPNSSSTSIKSVFKEEEK